METSTESRGKEKPGWQTLTTSEERASAADHPPEILPQESILGLRYQVRSCRRNRNDLHSSWQMELGQKEGARNAHVDQEHTYAA